jgi:polyhydroxyalkanoate synthase
MAALGPQLPRATVSRSGHSGGRPGRNPRARRFVQLEDWANEGEPLPYPAARELIEEMFGRDVPGSGQWLVGGRAVVDEIAVPALHLLPGNDRIAPAETAPAGTSVSIDSGHVGMIVGSARSRLHDELGRFLGETR